MASTDVPTTVETDDLRLIDHQTAWVRLLSVTTIVLVAADVIYQGLALAVIPPFAVFVVLRLVGLGLLRRGRMKGGPITLLVVSALILVMFAPAIPDTLAHPDSGVDFVHGVVAVGGALLSIVAAAGILRGASEQAARRLGAVAAGVTAVALVAATVATLGDASPAVATDDTVVLVEQAQFEDATVASGGSLYVDNRDIFRHTFTIDGEDIDVELPASEARRVAIDLAPGTYTYLCAVPGHEFMEGTLTVTG